jgi:hypothetical protein
MAQRLLTGDGVNGEVRPGAPAMLVRAVAVLALPADRHGEGLRSLGSGEPGFADELGMELRNAVLLSAQFERAGWITPEVHRILCRV